MFGNLLGKIVASPFRLATAACKVGNKALDEALGEKQEDDDKPLEKLTGKAGDIVQESVEEAFDN